MNLALQRWVLDKPWQAIFFCIFITVLATSGLKNFTETGDPRAYFAEDDPVFMQFTAIEEKYAGTEMLAYVIHPKDDKIFTREILNLVETLTEEAWLMPHSTRVDSISNFQHSRVDGDDLEVEYMIEDALNYSDEKLAQREDIIMAEPTMKNALISEKGHVTAVFIRVVMNDQNVDAVEIMDFARELREKYRTRYPNVELMLTGTVPFSQAAIESTHSEMKMTMPIGLGLVIILLYAMLRSVNLTMISLVLVIFSIMAGAGMGSWVGIVFTPMVGAGPAMILTLAVANSVHILVAYLQSRRTGLNRYDGMAESLRINMQPVFLTSTTTAVGFLCLNFSDSPPFHDLGNIVAMGVMVSYILSMVMMPALVMVTPDKEYKAESVASHRIMVKFGDWVIEYAKPLFFIMGAVIVVLVAYVPTTKLEDNWHDYFDETFEVRRANDFMTRELTGMNRLDFSFPANPNQEQGALDVVYQQKLDDFTQWVKTQPNVVSVSTFSDIVKRLNRDMNQANEDFYNIPDKRELISQYTLLFELSLPMGLGIDNQMTMDKMHSMVTVVADGLSSAEVKALERTCWNWIDENFPDYMKASGSGLDLMFSNLALNNVNSMIKGTLIAMLLVSGLLIFALRSLKYGILSLLPNLLPALTTFGVWAILVGNVGLPAAVVASLTIGIVVDDTVHFLSKYVRAKRELNYDTTEAVRYAFNTVGVALVFTSVLLSANFGILAFSHFQPNANMGMLTSLTIFMALIVDFLFFVPLLLIIDKRLSKNKESVQNTSEVKTEGVKAEVQIEREAEAI
ncbi:MAG: MMPL family transporter [Pseudomonadales bacterium]|nr:MMPL family transporter [Pseudomonadales bacterium]